MPRRARGLFCAGPQHIDRVQGHEQQVERDPAVRAPLDLVDDLEHVLQVLAGLTGRACEDQRARVKARTFVVEPEVL